MAWAEERAVLKSAASSPAAGANTNTNTNASSSSEAAAAVAAELEQMRTDNAALRQQLTACIVQSKRTDITVQQLQSEVSVTCYTYCRRWQSSCSS
jgi:hypothetical protein